MKNAQNHEPITSNEFFLLMRLLQHLEDQGEIPGSTEADWQTIYEKLSSGCYKARQLEMKNRVQRITHHLST